MRMLCSRLRLYYRHESMQFMNSIVIPVHHLFHPRPWQTGIIAIQMTIYIRNLLANPISPLGPPVPPMPPPDLRYIFSAISAALLIADCLSPD